jgi:hypothetical protein
MLAGCASTTAGHGRLAGFPGGPAGTHAAAQPTLPTLPGQPRDPDPEVPDSPCDVLDSTEVHDAFGRDVTIDRRIDRCRLTAADESFLDINADAVLSLSFEESQYPGGRSVTIADRPAYLAQDGHFIVVGRSASPDDRGMLTCYVGFGGGQQAGGLLIATKILERVVPHYSY